MTSGHFITDLKSYRDILKNVSIGEPMFLTVNGRRRYVVMDIEDYEKAKYTLKLMGELFSGERSGKDFGCTDIDAVDSMFGI